MWGRDRHRGHIGRPEHEVNSAIVKLLTEDARAKGSFHSVYPAPDDLVVIDEARRSPS
jgi:hypothetical protein